MFYWPKLNSTQSCYEKYKKFMNSKSSQISNSVWLNGSLHDLYINNFASRSMIQQQMLSNLHCTLTDFLQNYIRNAHCILSDFFTTWTMHFQECFLKPSCLMGADRGARKMNHFTTEVAWITTSNFHHCSKMVHFPSTSILLLALLS